jgi:putative transposase
MSEQLWDGESGRKVFLQNRLGNMGEAMIGKYVKNQGDEYHKLHSNHQLALF